MKALADRGVRRALVVTAHPDDVDFGAAGTVAGWVDEGIEVHYCTVTDGAAGGSDHAVSRPEMALLRQAEQRAAAVMLGVTHLTFLGYPDGRLEPSLELRRDLSRVIRQVRPQRVMCQWPQRDLDNMYASHPDHTAAGEAVMSAVYPDARNPFAHTELLADEGLAAHAVAEVWLMSTTAGPPAIAVDVTDRFALKMSALRCHQSQMTDPEAIESQVRDWMSANARAAGLGVGRLGETFRILDTA